MPLEPEGFREYMLRLDERFPGVECISLNEACALVGKTRQTILRDKTFPAKKTGGRYRVPKVLLARWMT